MALILPTALDLLDYMHVDTWEPPEAETWAVAYIQQAADMLQVATGLSDEPGDDLSKRIKNRAILDMAFYLLVRAPDREEYFSPFTSERMGSYSYNKPSEAFLYGRTTGSMSSVLLGQTGVPAYDFAVAYFNDFLMLDTDVDYDTEAVFEKGLANFQSQSTEDVLARIFGSAWSTGGQIGR